MANLREQTSKFKKMVFGICSAFAEHVSKTVTKLGMQLRATFIRLSIAKRLRIILKTELQNKGGQLKLIPALALPVSNILPEETLPTLLTVFAMALIVYFGLQLVRAEGPEEQAKAQKVLAGCIIAGVLMAIAKPLAYWATGWDPNNNGNLPPELINAVDNLLNLLMYIGVVVVIAGIIYGGIQLAHTKPQTNHGTPSNP